jgi:serine/threonine protein kinase
MCPCHFKDLKKALQTLCLCKSCTFEALPPNWWQNEVKSNSEINFVMLKHHVMKKDYFTKSNASLHWGWSVENPMIVCIKKFPKSTKDCNIQREMDALKLVAQNDDTSRHNVIRFFGEDVDREGGTVLIFEMVQASNFNSELENITSQQIVAEYMCKLLQALSYVHKRNIVHRDVKPANFLHNFESKTFRLIDFGSAEAGVNSFVKKGGGTRGFKAPETLMGNEKQTAAVDVWSAGIILLSLITGRPHILSQQDKANGKYCDEQHLKEIGLIAGKTEMQLLHDAECHDYGDGCQHENKTGWAAEALKNILPGRKWKPDEEALDLLSKMLKVLPSQRITSTDALQHPFFACDKNRIFED